MTNIDLILGKLEMVKKTGHNKWISRCCCHYDKSPSLSIKDDGGTILIYCFGCGAKGPDVCQALGIDVSELFPPTDDIDYKKYPQRKLSIPADQALYALQTECTVIYMIARDMMDGRMDGATRSRLLQACTRVHAVTALYKD